MEVHDLDGYYEVYYNGSIVGKFCTKDRCKTFIESGESRYKCARFACPNYRIKGKYQKRLISMYKVVLTVL